MNPIPFFNTKHSLFITQYSIPNTLHSLFIVYCLLLIFIAPASAQSKFDIHPTKKIEANPINVAFMLAQETDTAKMASILHYYGYEPTEGQFSERSFPSEGKSSLKTQDSRLKTEYTHPNGSTIRYTFQDATQAQPYPHVEVKSKLTAKAVDSKLTDLKFKKEGSGYTRKSNQYSRTVFHCKRGSNGYLIFHQTRLPKE
ncbi:MAG: hypothetical protein K2K98_04575 [Muribaculaceae bacterium]|nr:hypothetical protein [Muribaculaceae bacterium]